MRLVIVGDIHQADNPPASRTNTYRQDIKSKLEWIVDFTNTQEDIDALLLEGDVFHIKRPDRNSHSMVVETADVLGSCKYPVLIVPGNHDVRGNMSTIPDQPLATLALHPNIELLTGPHPTLPLYGLPYFELCGDNYAEEVRKYHEAGGPDKYPFICTHQSIFPKKEGPIFDYISAEDWTKTFQAKWTAYGHIHTQMKVGAHWFTKNARTTYGGTWFCNEGSISRGSLTEHHLTRDVTIALFDSAIEDGDPFTSHVVPVRPAEEVFRLAEISIEKERVAAVDNFLTSLGSTELNFLTVESILDDAKASRDLSREAIAELEDIITTVAE